MSPKSKGLALVSKAKRTAIARKGGQAAQASGAGHQWDAGEAAAAGRTAGERNRQRRATEAALRILAAYPDLEPALNRHRLTAEEWIWFGGSQKVGSNEPLDPKRMEELLRRLS